MDKVRLSFAALAVNLVVAPATAAEPTRQECERSFVNWAFRNPPIISGFLRTRDDLAIALNEAELDRLDEAEAEHVRKCVDILLGNDDDPENWPLRPDEEI